MWRQIVDALIDGASDPAIESVDVCPVQALVVKAGNDSTSTVNAVTRIVTGLKLKQVAEPLLMVGSFQEIWLRQCRELGMTLAAGLEAGIF